MLVLCGTTVHSYKLKLTYWVFKQTGSHQEYQVCIIFTTGAIRDPINRLIACWCFFISITINLLLNRRNVSQWTNQVDVTSRVGSANQVDLCLVLILPLLLLLSNGDKYWKNNVCIVVTSTFIYDTRIKCVIYVYFRKVILRSWFYYQECIKQY